MNDESVIKLLETATFDTISDDLLEKLIPFLDEDSKNIIFDKILKGEINYRMIRVILPYAEYLTSPIEAAVVEGSLDVRVLKILKDYQYQKELYYNKY
jgi:hypothetical protein